MLVSSLLCRVSASLLLLGCVLLWSPPTVRADATSLDSPVPEKFQTSQNDLAALVAARKDDPQNQDAIRAIEEAVEDGLPDRLPSAWLPSLPVDTAPLPNNLGMRVVPLAFLPTPATESQHGWAFSHVTYIYVPADAENTNRLLCRVHYTQAGDADLAARFGGLLALAHRTLTQQTGREALNGDTPFDVWLCRKGQTGGEQWRSNIYFYDLDTPRSSIEWIREITHEYGHLALPPIGGYSAPEYWANGYYGERLITRWIARAQGGPALVAQVWGDFSGWPNFQRLLIAPALALYKKAGPSPTMATRTDDTGMRYLIGQILTCDDKYGARRLGEVFSHLPHYRTAKAADFEEAIAETLPRQARHRL
ncbi:MAG: hypothetical protein JO250_23200 [Armatimonadetes bacterium]|nr:hypothetical protein [Armatimonadota bacterium]